MWSRGHLHFTPGSAAPPRLFVESRVGGVVLVAEVGRDERGVFQPLLFSTTVSVGGQPRATAARECSCASRAQVTPSLATEPRGGCIG